MHISRGGGGVLGRGSGAQNGPILTRKSPKSTRNSPVLTQIGPGLARKSPGRPVAGSGEHGEEFFGLLNFCCTRQTLFYLGRFFRFPPPTPSRCYSMCGRGPCRNGRGRIFYKSHFKGAAPLWNPQGHLTQISFLYSLKVGLASPYGGAGAQWAPFCADRAGRRDGVTPVA